MIVHLFIRRDKKHPNLALMFTRLNREEGDTPRIANLALDIKNELDRITADCEKEGLVSSPKGVAK